MEQRFYICKHCGNIIGLIHDAGVPLLCCGEKMHPLVPNTEDAATEKHLPVVSREHNLIRVTVGSVEHPMTEQHHIDWIYLQTDRGGQRKCPRLEGAPTVIFALTDEDQPQAVFAYCNLHGLWKTEL